MVKKNGHQIFQCQMIIIRPLIFCGIVMEEMQQFQQQKIRSMIINIFIILYQKIHIHVYYHYYPQTL